MSRGKWKDTWCEKETLPYRTEKKIKIYCICRRWCSGANVVYRNWEAESRGKDENSKLLENFLSSDYCCLL